MKLRKYGILILTCFAGGCDKAPESQSNAEWIDPSKLTPGEVRHQSLTDSQISRITELQQTFKEVDPTPLEKWIDDFKREQDPDREIAIWGSIVSPYRKFASSEGVDLAMKNEAFGLLLMRSGGSLLNIGIE